MLKNLHIIILTSFVNCFMTMEKQQNNCFSMALKHQNKTLEIDLLNPQNLSILPNQSNPIVSQQENIVLVPNKYLKNRQQKYELVVKEQSKKLLQGDTNLLENLMFPQDSLIGLLSLYFEKFNKCFSKNQVQSIKKCINIYTKNKLLKLLEKIELIKKPQSINGCSYRLWKIKCLKNNFTEYRKRKKKGSNTYYLKKKSIDLSLTNNLKQQPRKTHQSYGAKALGFHEPYSVTDLSFQQKQIEIIKKACYITYFIDKNFKKKPIEDLIAQINHNPACIFNAKIIKYMTKNQIPKAINENETMAISNEKNQQINKKQEEKAVDMPKDINQLIQNSQINLDVEGIQSQPTEKKDQSIKKNLYILENMQKYLNNIKIGNFGSMDGDVDMNIFQQLMDDETNKTNEDHKTNEPKQNQLMAEQSTNGNQLPNHQGVNSTVPPIIPSSLSAFTPVSSKINYSKIPSSFSGFKPIVNINSLVIPSSFSVFKPVNSNISSSIIPSLSSAFKKVDSNISSSKMPSCFVILDPTLIKNPAPIFKMQNQPIEGLFHLYPTKEPLNNPTIINKNQNVFTIDAFANYYMNQYGNQPKSN